jgi:23S rRNA (uracil1939-C5)-methyltransferase
MEIKFRDPPCQYFSKCGGCSLQNIANYHEYKLEQLKQPLQELPFLKLHDLYVINERTRRRASFRVSNKKLSFNLVASNQSIAIDQCLLLEDHINQLIFPINLLLKKIKIKIEEISFTNSDTGLELLFISNDKSDLDTDLLLTSFAKEKNIARIAWKKNKSSPYTIVQFRPVQLRMDNISIDLPINCFLQVSKESHLVMKDIILKHIDRDKKILELYCGVGSFTVFLAKKANVTAIEGNEDSIKSLDAVAKRYNLPINAIKRDLYQTPMLTDELDKYTQVVINPPRNGATPQIKQIAMSSNIKKVILVSCSVENFIRDAKILLKENFVLENIYPIDQFLYSKHLELIAILSCR